MFWIETPPAKSRLPSRYRKSRILARSALAAVLALPCGLVQADSKLFAPWVGTDLKGIPCKTEGGQGYGPFDYTDPANQGRTLTIVTDHHFTPSMEALQTGNTGVTIAGDLAYTIRAIPNHHRALYTAIRYWFSGDSTGPYRLEKLQAPECLLQRARHFAPRDYKLAMLEAIYLHKRGLLEKAKERYEEAEAHLEYKGELYYNFGLLYFDMKNYQEARRYAELAREEAYPLPGLDRKLKGVGF